MIISNFNLNFSFKFFYSFTGQLKKLPKLNLKKLPKLNLLVMVLVKSFDKYHHLFNLYTFWYFILFFHDLDSGVLNKKVF